MCKSRRNFLQAICTRNAIHFIPVLGSIINLESMSIDYLTTSVLKGNASEESKRSRVATEAGGAAEKCRCVDRDDGCTAVEEG